MIYLIFAISHIIMTPPQSVRYPPQLGLVSQISTYFNLLPPPQITNARWASDPPYLLDTPTIREGRVVTNFELIMGRPFMQILDIIFAKVCLFSTQTFLSK